MPKFEIVGTPPSVVHLSLPSSASVFTRRGTIIAANGSAEDLTSKLQFESVSSLAKKLPVLYQKVSSTSPLSILLGCKPTDGFHTPYYSVVPVSSGYNWVVTQRKALLGWTGADTTVNTVSNFKLWGNIEVQGSNGQAVLVGEGSLYQIEVPQDKTVLVNPSNVIAYTVTADQSERRSFVRMPHTNLSALDLPLLRNYELPPSIKKFTEWVSAWATRLFWRDDIALRVSGPRTILVQTHATPINKVFDKQELRDLITDQPSS